MLTQVSDAKLMVANKEQRVVSMCLGIVRMELELVYY